MQEKISVIVPTYARQHLFPLLYDCFAKQTYPELEMLVFDDSPTPSNFFEKFPNVRYFYSNKRESIGVKRNFLISEAEGEIIAHFDDDDYYSPDYLKCMIGRLQGADFVHLTGWYAFEVSQRFFGYWNTTEITPAHFVFQSRSPLSQFLSGFIPRQTMTHFVFQSRSPLGLIKIEAPMDSYTRGYGFSYVYRKEIWRNCSFPDRNHGEDYAWVQSWRPGIRTNSFADHYGLVLHIIHLSNTSRCFPNYLLPIHLLEQVFRCEVLDYVRG